MAIIDALEVRPVVPATRWSDRWRAFRNGLIASPGFQSWASAFPLTRPIARRRAAGLFDLAAGFVYSQVAFACVRLGVLELLRAGPMTAGDVGQAVALSPVAAERLLKAAVSLRLVEPCGGGRFALGDQGSALLGAPGVVAMIEHHALLYADLADPVGLLQREGGGGRLSGFWPYAEGGPSDAASASTYSTLMSVSQTMVSAQVLEAYPIGRHRRLLDVGGGDGTFLRAVAARAPALELALFDLPNVAATATRRFADEGLKVDVSGGNFFEDPLPEGADIVSLVRVLHDHDDDRALLLLRAIRKAMRPGATLLISEPMSGTSGAEPMGDAYFGFYLLAMGSGRPRTVGEIRLLLQTAGFSRLREVQTSMPMIARVIAARAA